MNIHEAAQLFSQAHVVAFLGNGGNLAIAQHAASDFYRYTGKFSFAPNSVDLTALGGDGDWREPWVEYASLVSDLIVGITTRLDSPISNALGTTNRKVLLICPKEHATLPTLVVPTDRMDKFEVGVLSSIYEILRQMGVVLAPIK